MKTKNYFLIIIIALFAITGCSKNNPSPDPTPTGTTGATGSMGTTGATGATGATGTTGTTGFTGATLASGVYAIGVIAKSATDYSMNATIWKNGVGTMLSAENSNASGIAVQGADIYISGYSEPFNSGFDRIACYWKNKTMVKLTGATPAKANAITLKDGDIYLTGTTNTDAVYWKNGVIATLPVPSGATSPTTTGISVVGTDVYVCGWYVSAVSRNTACYWKNGILTSFTDSGTSSQATGIAAVGTDIYITGYTQGALSTSSSACYWKNGQVYTLYNASSISQAVTITTAGTDVYIAGYTNNSIIYWKNGNLVETNIQISGYIADPLPYWKNGGFVNTSIQNGTISTIAVQGNSVYIGGYYYSLAANINHPVASYWTNSSLTQLALPSVLTGFIYPPSHYYLNGMVVVP